MSDQDFFFDEEDRECRESKPAKKERLGASAKKSAPAKKSTRSSSAADAPFMERTVTMTSWLLMAVVTLLVGVIVGIVIPTDSGSCRRRRRRGRRQARQPQLSPEQLNTGMPEGHPDIGDMSAEAAPSGEVVPEGATRPPGRQ